MSDDRARFIRFGTRRLRLPADRRARLGLGGALVAGGLLGFLPILGFWMVPLGLFVLSQDLPAVRRWRRRLQVWWERRRRARGGPAPSGEATPPAGDQISDRLR